MEASGLGLPRGLCQATSPGQQAIGLRTSMESWRWKPRLRTSQTDGPGEIMPDRFQPLRPCCRADGEDDVGALMRLVDLDLEPVKLGSPT